MTIEQAINKTLKIVDSETENKDVFWVIPIASELEKLDCSLLIQCAENV